MFASKFRLGHLFNQRLDPGEGVKSACLLLSLAIVFDRTATAPEQLNLHLIVLGLAVWLIVAAPSTRPHGLPTLPATLHRLTERELMLPGLLLGLAGLYTHTQPMLVVGLALTLALFFATRSRG